MSPEEATGGGDVKVGEESEGLGGLHCCGVEGGPAIVGGRDPERSGPVGNLKLLVRHPSRENKSMQEMDRGPEVAWSLCAMVSKGLEAVGGYAYRGKRSRSAI